MSRYLNTVSHWYGRLGNNIQQICNGILYSKTKDEGFFSPPHDLINQVIYDSEGKTMIRPSRLFHYNTSNKDFDIDLDFLYKNIRQTCLEYIVPNFKYTFPTDSFDDQTIVIHIRSGDIFAHEHNPPHDYVPNPLCYYLNLIEEYDRVVVVTEPDNYNPIVDKLRNIDKVTVQSTDVWTDFSTLLRAKNLASSGTGTFAIAAALCSKNIKNFYCTDLYLTEHLNPEMLMSSGDITVHVMQLENYLSTKQWTNTEEQRKFILEYQNQ